MKKLYRSKENRVIGGIAGGLGEHFDIDPIFFRIAFIFLGLAGGGIILYLLLLLLIPLKKDLKNT